MKNRYVVHDDRIEIFLRRKSDGLEMSTFVSNSQLNRLLAFDHTWYPKWDKSAKCFYVCCGIQINRKKYTVFLHRWVTDAVKGLVVDHINHDTMDNTDENLRQVDRIINGRNRKGPNCNNSSSGIRNVSFSKKLNKWVVSIEDQGKANVIGRYSDLKEAEQAAIIAREAIYARKVV